MLLADYHKLSMLQKLFRHLSTTHHQQITSNLDHADPSETIEGKKKKKKKKERKEMKVSETNTDQ